MLKEPNTVLPYVIQNFLLQAKTKVVKKQVTKPVSDKQTDSKDTVKQSKSDIELHTKEQEIAKPTEITPH